MVNLTNKSGHLRVALLHLLLMRLCSYCLLHMLLMRLCSHRLAPPHGLHVLLGGVVMVVQMLAPPHCLHLYLWRWCSQMLAPPPCWNLLHLRFCSQISNPLIDCTRFSCSCARRCSTRRQRWALRPSFHSVHCHNERTFSRFSSSSSGRGMSVSAGIALA